MIDSKVVFLQKNWSRLYPQLKSYVYAKVKCEESTKDILQETFIKAFSNINALRNTDKLEQWLYSITRNEANTYFNAEKKQQAQTLEIDLGSSELFNIPIAEYAAPFINALPQKYSEALKLVYIENLSQKELAVRLNISYSGAKSRVQRGKEKLKELIIACCHIEHDSYGNILDYTRKEGGFCPVSSSCA